jgi:hypothetical protein
MHTFEHPCHMGTCRPAPEAEHHVRSPSPTQQVTHQPQSEWPLALVLITLFLSVAAVIITFLVVAGKGH